VLVLSHDVFHERSGTVIAVALTSQEPRAGYPLTPELTARVLDGLMELVG
jgi:mRNA interferase MazF